MNRCLIGISLYAVAVAFLCFVSPTVVRDVQLFDQNSKHAVTLPLTLESRSDSYRFSAQIYMGWRSRSFLTLRAGDCLLDTSLNGQALIPDKLTIPQRQPVRVQLPVNVTPGWHELNWTVLNKQGEDSGCGVMDIRQAHGFSPPMAILAFLCGSTWLVASFRLRLSWWTGVLGCFAILLVIHYHLATDPWLRQNDVGGHREYISHLLAQGTLPAVRQGWGTWQPPLYYMLSAVWIKAVQGLSSGLETFRCAQWFAAALYLICVVAGTIVWQEFRMTKETGWLGLVVFSLLPAHVLLSAKVNNDCLMPLWGLIVTVLLWRYGKEDKLSTLIWTGMTIAFSMMTKTSSLAFLLGSAITVLVADLLRKQGLRQGMLNLYILALPSTIWLGFWLFRNYEQTGQWMYVNAALPDDLLVDNEYSRFVRFDWGAFINADFYETPLRASFPGALGLSLLTGEFTFHYLQFPFNWLLRFTFLPVLGFLVVGFLKRGKPLLLTPWMPAAILLASHALFMVAYNWRYPYACNQDARLWAPVFFPAAVLVALGFETLWAKAVGHARWVVFSLPFPFVACLLLFYAYLAF